MHRDKNKIFAPSILSADFSDIQGALLEIEESGSDWIHLDVMDGVFVPNITFGHKMVKDIRKKTKLPLDVHLMTVNPENLVQDFIEAGADYITFHLEASIHSHRLIHKIKNSGCKAGISIVPGTPAASLSELLPYLDLILIMSVNPGFGGQTFIPESLQKISYLNKQREDNGYNYLISVDGGVNKNTAEMIRNNGADILISGSSFFNSSNKEFEVRKIRGDKEV